MAKLSRLQFINALGIRQNGMKVSVRTCSRFLPERRGRNAQCATRHQRKKYLYDHWLFINSFIGGVIQSQVYQNRNLNSKLGIVFYVLCIYLPIFTNIDFTYTTKRTSNRADRPSVSSWPVSDCISTTYSPRKISRESLSY